jgi:hypothetical protein
MRQLTQRAAVDGGVGDDQIVSAQTRQPECFREREAQRPAKAAFQRTLLQSAHTQGFRRQTERDASGATHQVRQVDIERIEVNDRKRRVQARSGDFQPALERCLEKVHPNRGRYPLRDELESRPEHGT